MHHNKQFLQVNIPSTKQPFTLVSLEGEESMSDLFEFRLIVVTSSSAIIKCDEFIGKPISFQINPYSNQSPIFFHGIVNNFSYSAAQQYALTVVPLAWLLTQKTDCRIFQEKSVIEIIESIFKEINFAHYDLSGVMGTGRKNKRMYCVQYCETTLEFISRLIHEEGMFYYFHHTKDKHIMVFADNSTTCKSCHNRVIYSNDLPTEDHLHNWHRSYNFHTNKITQSDYNFETPSTKLITSEPSKNPNAQINCEVYNFPGKYDNLNQGKMTTKYLMELRQLRHCKIFGAGNYANFSSGKKFTLIEHENNYECGEYLITKLHLSASNWDSTTGKAGDQKYSNNFICIPIDTPYRTEKNIHKPTIHSSQTAIVVGGKDDEIYVDHYGRVKVQFFWDRYGKFDDHSSCWIRVAQSIAGQNWGHQFIPRVNQEVIVNFLNGDPDKPIIIGCVYNKNNQLPYTLPNNKTQSGIKTRSTKNGAITEANELRFEDKKGAEEIYLHAQRNLNYLIENNQTTIINHGDQITNIKEGNSVLEAKNAIEFKVANNSILINQNGITINGKLVAINS